MHGSRLLVYAEEIHRTANTPNIKTLNLHTVKCFLSLCMPVVHGKGCHLIRYGSTEGDETEQRRREESGDSVG